MPNIRTLVLDQVVAAAAAVASVPRDPMALIGLGEADLLRMVALTADMRRSIDAFAALTAGAVARRSAPELGGDGLARRAGFRTVDEFVKTSIGLTGAAAKKAVRTGRIMHDTVLGGETNPLTGEVAEPTAPWMAPAVAAVAKGRMSVDCLEAIRIGLGEPVDSAMSDAFAAAIDTLCSEVAEGLDAISRGLGDSHPFADRVDPERLHRRARAIRDELDYDGIAAREAELYEARWVSIKETPSGMWDLRGRLAPEMGLKVKNVIDRATSPRRNGPRFVETAQDGAAGKDPTSNAAIADRILADTRTIGQLACDALIQLIEQGAEADTDYLLGSGAPVVNVAITERDLREGTGYGQWEGTTTAASIETVERLGCAGVTVPIVFDANGQSLDAGREQRLFTWRQKRILAVRDNGCRWGDCDRPPSWTEAHHIEHWHRDHGATDTANGILLCKHHHLKLHNEHFEIVRNGEHYWLKPPPERDPEQRLIPMHTRSLVMRRLATQSAVG